MKFFENPNFPEYLKNREDFERLQWQGDDSSLKIFPHLEISWRDLRRAQQKSGKPVGDLGASFSTLPVEGELQGVKAYPVDIMHMQARDTYETILELRMINALMTHAYEGKAVGLDQRGSPYTIVDAPIKHGTYDARVYDAIAKAKANYIVADLTRIPVRDRFFSTTILHDSLPKHSKDWDIFIAEQLPEILRVTDQTARIYPMSIYKTELRELEESDPLFNNQEMMEKIKKAAAAHGFTFNLRPGSHYVGQGRLLTEQDPRCGIFERAEAGPAREPV